MKCRLKWMMVFFLMLTLTSCATTAMYTSPSVIDEQNHVYNFSIETGGYAGVMDANERAAAEINKFMNENHYRDYKILSRRHLDYDFSGFKYAVQFYR